MDQNLYSVRWNDYRSILTGSINEQMMMNLFTDVTLVADGETFNAHKIVLAACSPYFLKIFSQLPEDKQGIIFLKGVSSSMLRNLMQFMYSGTVEVSNETLPEFLDLGKELQIKGLIEAQNPQTTTPDMPSINQTPLTPPLDLSKKITPMLPQVPSFQFSPFLSQTPFKLPSINMSDQNSNAPTLLNKSSTIPYKRFLDDPRHSLKRRKLLEGHSENERVNQKEESNAGTSTNAESSGLMCSLSSKNNPILAVNDFLYFYDSTQKHWMCVHYYPRSRKIVDYDRCKVRLRLEGDGKITMKNEHNHPPDTERIRNSRMIPYHPSLLEKSTSSAKAAN